MSKPLEASFLYLRAQLTCKSDIGPRRKPQASLRAHVWPEITLPDPLLTLTVWLSGTPTSTTRILPYQYKYHFLLAQGLFLEPPKIPTRRPSGARYSCATYSWIARFSRFTNPTTLPDHPHILNVVILIYQCEHLWIVADISAWRSYNQAAQFGWLQGDRNVWIIQLWGFEIFAPTETAQACINIPLSPSRKGFTRMTQNSSGSDLIPKNSRTYNRSSTLLHSL